MNLTEYIENVLEDVKGIFDANELDEAVGKREGLLDHEFVGKSACVRDSECLEKLFEEIRIYKLLCVLGKNIIEMALVYSAMVYSYGRKFTSRYVYSTNGGGRFNGVPDLDSRKNVCRIEENKVFLDYSTECRHDTQLCLDYRSEEDDKICDKGPLLISRLLRSQELLFSLERECVLSETRLCGEILDKILFMLSQGSLENDVRFSELMEKTLKEMERFEMPEVVRMSVQFVIAKKYVDDVIALKGDVLLRKYFWENHKRR